MKALSIMLAMTVCGFAQANAATCSVPPGKYEYIMSDGQQSYYYNDNYTIRVAGNSRIVEPGDFDVTAGAERFQREGDKFTYANPVGKYERFKSGPIYYLGGQYTAAANMLPAGAAYNDGIYGTYRKQSDGKITFTPKRQLKPLVITEANCNTGQTVALNYDQVVKDLGARREGDNMMVDLDSDILFAYDSDKISPKAANKLSQLGYLINHDRKGMVVLRGHTDSKGGDDYNIKLSQKRAQSVANYLTKNSSVPPTAIMAQGLGEGYPKAANTNPDGSDNPEGRAINRRVEVIIQTVENAEIPKPRAVIATGRSVVVSQPQSVVTQPQRVVVENNSPESVYRGKVVNRVVGPTGGVITYADGASLTYGNDGNYVLTKPDGSTVMHSPGSGVVTTY